MSDGRVSDADSGTVPAGASADPNDRVHHHARLDEEGRPVEAGGVIVTLCGLRLDRPRPEAGSLPCCPMCNAEMGERGRGCP